MNKLVQFALQRSVAATSEGGAALPSLTRCFAKKSSIAEPTYTYLPSGCSIQDPISISLSDAVVFTDPAPEQPAANKGTPEATEQPQKNAKGGKAELPVHALMGAGTKDTAKVPYKMVDDYSQQTYVYNAPRHSMREPKYVSISDPLDAAAQQKPSSNSK